MDKFVTFDEAWITELLRNGASLVETRELARHRDIRMTMKFTHIGLEDKSDAVAKLPAFENWPRPGSGTLHTDAHSASSTDDETAKRAAGNTK